jgi:hypothetical protein
MAVTTILGHVSRARDFYDKTSIYFCLGKTSAWSDESNPPIPLNTDSIEEVAGYKLVESKFLVIPDTDGSGEITYRDTKWKIVPYDEAFSKGARWVYVMSYISYDDFSTDLVYRQIGICTGLTKKSTVASGKSNLLPSEVDNPGILEVLDNRTPIYREVDQREKLSVIIEF